MHIRTALLAIALLFATALLAIAQSPDSEELNRRFDTAVDAMMNNRELGPLIELATQRRDQILARIESLALEEVLGSTCGSLTQMEHMHSCEQLRETIYSVRRRQEAAVAAHWTRTLGIAKLLQGHRAEAASYFEQALGLDETDWSSALLIEMATR